MDSELFKRVENMSDEDKKSLIAHLQNSLEPDPEVISVDKRYSELLEIAEDLFDYKMKTSRRDAEDVMIRRFIAYRLRIEGFSFASIGHAIGKNHSTVFHLVRQMDDYFSLPNLYKDDIKKYLEFDSRATRETNECAD